MASTSRVSGIFYTAGSGELLDLLRGHAVSCSLRYNSVGSLFGEIPWVSYYLRYLPFAAQDPKRMREMAFARAEQRYTSGSTSKDLFYYLVSFSPAPSATYSWLIQSNEDGSDKVDPPRPLVISDGLLALVAGSDTTATVLANIFYCLMCYPDAYKRLVAEVDHFYPPGENSLDSKHLKHMHYLEAVM